ncbi:MotE family protein [Mameliella sediminis]|uniref:MotE family protein n=1 Tax=Mameliella sediminis TaxID=2836866 RepID=UPI001C4650AB|nr:Rnase Y domain-containing protein [Mameliella sediminis]MBV7395425.1 DUF3552 domain-containing protein [Mameliella sediminis]
MAKPKVSKRPAGEMPAKKRRRRKPRGALAAICALLVTSGLLRMAIGASEALAREGGTDPKPEQIAALAPVDPKAAAPVGAAKDPARQPRIVAEADIEPLLKALDAREERIRKRESAIDVRMQALAVAEEEIERKMQALAVAEASLKETLALARTAAADDIEKLTTVYANMKPKQAAALFQEMDPEFAAGFLARMRPDAAAAIMAGMSPQSAYLVSVILAGRNADVPKD